MRANRCRCVPSTLLQPLSSRAQLRYRSCILCLVMSPSFLLSVPITRTMKLHLPWRVVSRISPLTLQTLCKCGSVTGIKEKNPFGGVSKIKSVRTKNKREKLFSYCFAVAQTASPRFKSNSFIMTAETYILLRGRGWASLNLSI